MRLIYNIGIWTYRGAIGVASLFNEKARLWISGRWGWEERLREGIQREPGWIWFHCASLGEFEQGRPLIEAIKAHHPTQKILLTFFSPSGYELRKSYPHADYICYLPLDTAANARKFLDIVQPKLVFFVKYDLWLNFIAEAHRRSIHMVLVSVLVRKKSRFLKSWLKGSYRNAFRSFSWIFTQDKESAVLLENFTGGDRISVAGDTRFDRVAELPAKFQPVPGIDGFIRRRHCVVVGSTWPPDENILLPVIKAMRRADLCWIIAPHEIHPAQIDRHLAADPEYMVKYSAIDEANDSSDVLWIDNVGMLSRLYHSATLVYIGGGFGTGIHNTQEPAVYGNPVIFGPNFSKFQEAVDLVKQGGAVTVSDSDELRLALERWLGDPKLLAETRAANAAYIQSKTGATAAILTKLKFLNYFDGAERV
ncbi:MAG TPA: glycosyltransferase N-terminal domain-containing protein [Bacteroidia bacterium]|nr:glycosyltransferase N-terminal domain-containing protein [Bacteroidia bacterium]